jgi:hypothetical protein
VAVLELRLPGAHPALDQRLHHLELPVGAALALHVVQDLDGDRGRVGAEHGALLLDPPEQLLHGLGALDLDRVAIALVEREARDDPEPDQRHQHDDRHPHRAGTPAAALVQPARAL